MFKVSIVLFILELEVVILLLFACSGIFSDLEKTSSEIKRPDTSVGVLGNSGLLSLDPVEDKTPLYNQLLQTYNWNERVGVQ